MKGTHRIGAVAATLGLAVVGLVGPLASATSASTDVPAAAAAADNWYGPYRDLGTCNYWKSAMNAAGIPTTSCHQPFLDGTWWFIAL
jgi:hypothetical protein